MGKGGASSGCERAAALPDALARRLARLGIAGDADLLLHLPLRYEDETRLTPIARARPGESALIEGTVTDCEVRLRPRRQLVAHMHDEGADMALRFFSFYPAQQKLLAPGTRVRAFGEVRGDPRGGGLWGGGVGEMVHPRVRAVAPDEPLAQALTPVYPTTAGLSQPALRRLIDGALERASLTDTLPDALRQSLALPVFAEALRLLHHPPAGIAPEALAGADHPAWRRVRFDELLAQQLSLRRAYAARRARHAPLLGGGDLPRRLMEHLPFRLTGAQQRVWREIAADLAQPHPMQRLLQGDVGSGKTVIAALAMLAAAGSGRQAALMAPTEILAEQHTRKLAAWLEPLGVPLAWLSGGMGRAARAAMIESLSSGRVLLAVGTHALIEEAVDFPRLGLVIVDEQHRFGVRQRLALRDKGGDALERPHQLAMSATPIPRTLAMSYGADLDVSVLDELPPGRTPVLTKLVSEARRDQVIARVRDACAAGAQAYWVCPLIEESEALQLKTAVETFERLRAELPGLAVGLVHGRLPAADKAQVMAGFAAGSIHLLVATTVIEVGVDVPNASLMVIEHAERFGLAQLHQLRGRVGRGARESVCILLYQTPLSGAARARLRIIFEHADGFEIARQDLHLRGPGEFLGARQSGAPLLRFADLERDVDLLEAARAAAPGMLRQHPELAGAHIERWLGGRAALGQV